MAWEVAARAALAAADPVMARLIVEHGELGPASRRAAQPEAGAFGRLTRIVIGQQVSTAAARTIHGRYLDLFGGAEPRPEQVAAIGEEPLRGAGLSGRKVSYILGLADSTLSGELDLATLETLDDDSVIETISSLRGFGRWSAEMFCMFSLQRPDVFSGGDLGLRRGIQHAYRLDEAPSPDQAVAFAERWRPYRTIAAIYLWAAAAAPPLED